MVLSISFSRSALYSLSNASPTRFVASFTVCLITVVFLTRASLVLVHFRWVYPVKSVKTFRASSRTVPRNVSMEASAG